MLWYSFDYFHSRALVVTTKVPSAVKAIDVPAVESVEATEGADL